MRSRQPLQFAGWEPTAFFVKLADWRGTDWQTGVPPPGEPARGSGVDRIGHRWASTGDPLNWRSNTDAFLCPVGGCWVVGFWSPRVLPSGFVEAYAWQRDGAQAF